MTVDRYPACQGPDPQPNTPGFEVPTATIDCHAHIFGSVDKYPFSPARGYTPPEASLESYQHLHKVLGNIKRAVLTQPSVYGTDNSCMMYILDQVGEQYKAVVAVDADVTDEQLDALGRRGACGVRVNLADKGGNPFEDLRAVQRFTERLKDSGWHLEVLVHVDDFDDLYDTIQGMAVDVSFGHLGYMKTDKGIDHPGFQQFLNLLRDGKGWAKLTGTYRITTSEVTPYTDVEPFARAIIEANEERVVWGTDWPHPTFKGIMPNDGALFDQLAAWAPSESLRRKIMVENAETFYGFPIIS
ncbi:MAG: GntR family transcriptional regulator [Hyphomicrobiaceae bacterium TMED74]|nr:GntR family transcriptional regulator [Filomicrobium sp.]RPG37763.1 MAG: GntR family transcriptional regulator [Hyphomicrobiaceae bacterium TMED74]